MASSNSNAANYNAISILMLQIGVSSIFLFSIRLLSSPLVFLSHFLIVVVLAMAAWNRQLSINKTIGFLLALIAAHGIIGIITGQVSLFLFTENFGRMLAYYVAFSSILMGSPVLLRYAVQFYLKICVWVAALGLFALASYMIGFRPGYDFSWLFNSWHHIAWGGFLGLPRAQSIFGEPSHAVYTLGPAIYFAAGRILGSHQSFLSMRGALIIFFFIFLTNSTTAFATLPVAFLLNLRLSKKLVLSGSLVILAAVVFLQVSGGLDFSLSLRKIELLYLLVIEDGQTQGVSGSSYTAYVGNAIAWEMFQNTYLLGGGLGSFEFSAGHLFDTLQIASGNFANAQSGGSLMARTIGELGIFGIGLWVAAIVLGLRGIFKFPDPYHAINLAMLTGFLPFFIRMGTYEAFGLAFFVTVFIINAQHATRYRQQTQHGQADTHMPPSVGHL